MKHYLSLIQNIIKGLNSRDKRFRKAIKNIHDATNETLQYLSTREDKKVQHKSQPKLAESWNEAAASISEFDEGFAETLYAKGRFWSFPNRIKSDGEDVATLTEIRKNTEQLLREGA